MITLSSRLPLPPPEGDNSPIKGEEVFGTFFDFVNNDVLVKSNQNVMPTKVGIQ
jgi:hypothetical protein